jgi:hypothetical protein
VERKKENHKKESKNVKNGRKISSTESQKKGKKTTSQFILHTRTYKKNSIQLYSNISNFI